MTHQHTCVCLLGWLAASADLTQIEGLSALVNLEMSVNACTVNWHLLSPSRLCAHLRVCMCLMFIVVFLSLYLSNNRLTRLSGLESNVRLRELYLGENAIPRIEGLHTLRALTILSLYDNDIAAIEGLEHNTALTELNLARNHIHHVGQSVDGDTSDAVNA